MESNQIKPDKITKPIQLLAVWMTGLILLVSAFLTAAGTIKEPKWLPGFLAISAVCIIPLFLILVFLLQTKFRPEMQEDTFYSGYLDSITRQKMPNPKSETNQESEYEKLFVLMNTKFTQLSEQTKVNLERINEQISKVDFGTKEIQEAINIIKQTDETLDKAEFGLINGRVNIHLPNFQAVIQKLANLGISIGSSFGENGGKPDKILVTVGKRVNPQTLQYILPNLIDLGFTNINRTDMKEHETSILIGSYSYKSEKFVPINQELIKKIIEVKSLEDLGDQLPQG